MRPTLLIDGDIYAYEAASRGQQTQDWGDGVTSVTLQPVEEVISSLDDRIKKVIRKLGGGAAIVCLSVPSSEGWRKAVLPSYKDNRSGVAKPEMLPEVKDFLRDNYKVMERPTLEADDIMGIVSTSEVIVKGPKIIVSIDKDMKTIPGMLFNPSKDTEPRLITLEEADYWHMYQTLVGDTTDGYKGCPGVGPVKAEAILRIYAAKDGLMSMWPRARWNHIVTAYEAKGLTEADALVQARVARICRSTDYDFTRKEVIHWNPPK